MLIFGIWTAEIVPVLERFIIRNRVCWDFGAMAATSSERPPQEEEIRPPTPEDSDDSDEEGWQDVEQDEEESQPIVGLFSETIYPDVKAMLQETKDKHDFDLQKVQKDFGAYIQNIMDNGGGECVKRPVLAVAFCGFCMGRFPRGHNANW